MFDFDEIETDVQRKGADAWKEGATGKKDEPAAAAAAAVPEVKEEAPAPRASVPEPVPPAPKQEIVTICVGFSYKGQTWAQEFKVSNGTTVLELKKLMTPDHPEEASWFQLMKGGLPAEDPEPLDRDMRLEFAYLPPRKPVAFKKLDMGEASAGGWHGEMEVIVCLDRISSWATSFKVKKGSTIAQLKEKMVAQDPTGATRLQDFDLAVNGSNCRWPLDASTLIVDNRLSQLELVGPVAA